MRQGKRVDSYERGKGKKPSSSRARKSRKVVVGKKLSKTDSSFSKFNVSIIYLDGKSERKSVQANEYSIALDKGLQSRTRVDGPKKILIRGIT